MPAITNRVFMVKIIKLIYLINRINRPFKNLPPLQKTAFKRHFDKKRNILKYFKVFLLQ